MASALSRMETPENIEKAAKPGEEPLPDRRRSARRRVLKAALIAFSGGRCAMACTILDISEAGALVMPEDILTCPKEFSLKPSSGPERACEVVWRKRTMMGVRFV